MFNHPNLEELGHVAVFYIPKKKLVRSWGGWTAEEHIKKFLLDNFNALTVEDSDTQGFWRKTPESPTHIDENVRYEVSFGGGIPFVTKFIDFLAWLCKEIDEEAIYVTMGYHAYLVTRKDNSEV